MFMHYIWVYSITIKMSGDIEMNPGPKPSSCNKFSICHWNLNIISAHNFIKLSLLRAYISVHNFDILCLSETYLDSTISSNDSNLIIPGYELYRADHPSNVKRGGICIYYKNLLPLKVTNIQYLQGCINFEMKIGDKLCNFVALYRSPSQSQDEFEKFAKNLELNLDTISANNPFLTVVLGDFNAKSNFWYKNDKTTNEGSKIDGIASQFGLHQLINEPTHLTRNGSSCIDLIFTSQSNLVMESGVHSSLHENCHHQITFAKFNLKIYYPPSYEREVWHYQKANSENIRKAINEFP